MLSKALTLYSQVDNTTYSMNQMNETQRRLAFQQFQPKYKAASIKRRRRRLFDLITYPDAHGRKILSSSRAPPFIQDILSKTDERITEDSGRNVMVFMQEIVKRRGTSANDNYQEIGLFVVLYIYD